MFFFDPFKLYNAYSNFFDRTPQKKVDHTNARYKVIKTTTTEEVFYSDAENIKKAESDGWKAFNIFHSDVKKCHTGVNIIVLENPHRKIDDDGYDLITGIQDPINKPIEETT